jgi:hypothetical protein
MNDEVTSDKIDDLPSLSILLTLNDRGGVDVTSRSEIAFSEALMLIELGRVTLLSQYADVAVGRMDSQQS